LANAKHLYSEVPARIHTPELSKKVRKGLLSYLKQPSCTSEEIVLRNVLEKHKPLSLNKEIMKLRRIKSPAERVAMRKAADVSGISHAKVNPVTCGKRILTRFTQTMRFGSQAKTEAQLSAHFEYICALEGAQRPAYVPVVAAG
jgi:intermediate cleaving peptidase 55